MKLEECVEVAGKQGLSHIKSGTNSFRQAGGSSAIFILITASTMFSLSDLKVFSNGV